MKKVVFYLMAAAIVLATGCKDDKAVSVTGVTLDQSEISLVLGDAQYGKAQLTATVVPENADNKNLIWASDNQTIATVSNGLVTSLRVGTANITVTTEEGNFKATCKVTVSPLIIAVTGVTLSSTALTVEEGATQTLTPTIAPANATNKAVTWKSSNDAIATVSETGEVTGVAQGEAAITVATEDGNKTATCAVTVTPPGVLNQPAAADLWYVQAKLTWKEGFEVTNMLVKGTDTGSEFDKNVELTEADITARSFVVTELEPGKNYEATLCNGETPYNSFTFKTPAIPADGVIAIPLGADFRTLINSYARDGWVLNFAAGEYTVERISIKTSITFKGATGGTKITNANNWKMFGNGTDQMEVTFDGIHFYGGNQDLFNVDASKSAANGPSINMKTFTVKNCTLENYTRYFFTTADPGDIIKELVVDNCVVKSITGGNGRVFNSTSATQLSNATVKNSTFANVNRVFNWTAYTGAVNVTVESCTFNNVGDGTLFGFDKAPVKFTISKSLFTEGKKEAMQTVSRTAAGTVTSTDNYNTADYIQAAVPGNPEDPNYTISMTQYDGNAATLFVDPAKGDFHIKDAAFAGRGKSGDPRWY
jgi:hypothetical protein